MGGFRILETRKSESQICAAPALQSSPIRSDHQGQTMVQVVGSATPMVHVFGVFA